MNYNDNNEIQKFINGFLTKDIADKFHIKSIEKTNVYYAGNHILAPFIEFFVKGLNKKEDEERLKENFVTAFQKYFETDIVPGVVFRHSALWVREYRGRYFHLCAANDSRDRNFVDYILYEVTKEGYDAILNTRYAYCPSGYDNVYIRRFNSDDEEYMEIWNHRLSENLLRMLGL